MDGRVPSDSDRLPWLEPYRDASARTASRRQSRPMGGPAWGWLAVVAAGLLGAAGYWLGRSEAPRSSVTAAIPSSPEPAPLPYRTLDDRLTDNSVTPEQAEPEARPERAADRPAARPKRRIIRAVPRDTHLAETRRLQEETAPPRPPSPPVPRAVVPLSRQPVGKPGQVLYLGSFVSANHADGAYLRLVARYPYLGTLPRVITPNPQPGRTTYQLRIGAGSKRNAKVLCKNLKAIGHGCAVV